MTMMTATTVTTATTTTTDGAIAATNTATLNGNQNGNLNRANANATGKKPLVPATVFCLEVKVFLDYVVKNILTITTDSTTPLTGANVLAKANAKDAMEKRVHALQCKANELADAYGASFGDATELLPSLLTAAKQTNWADANELLALTGTSTTTTTIGPHDEDAKAATAQPNSDRHEDTVESDCHASEITTIVCGDAHVDVTHGNAVTAQDMATREQELTKELSLSRESEKRLRAEVAALRANNNPPCACATSSQSMALATANSTDAVPSPTTETDSESSEAGGVNSPRATVAFTFTYESVDFSAKEAQLALLRKQLRQQRDESRQLVATLDQRQAFAMAMAKAKMAKANADQPGVADINDTQSEPGEAKVWRSRIPPPRIVVPRRRCSLPQPAQEPTNNVAVDPTPAPPPPHDSITQSSVAISPVPRAQPTGTRTRPGTDRRRRPGTAATPAPAAQPLVRSPRASRRAVEPTASPTGRTPARPRAVVEPSRNGDGGVRGVPQAVRTQPAPNTQQQSQRPRAARRASLQPRQPPRWR